MTEKETGGSPAMENLRASLGNSGKREQILKGALATFLELGYAGTSIDKVAAQARVSKPTIYVYFKDKEALFGALIDLICSHLVGTGSDQSDLEIDPGVFLPKFAGNFLKRMDEWEYVAFMRLVLGESGRFPEIAQLYTAKVIQPSIQKVSNYLANNKKLNFPDPDATARIFVGALNSHIISHEMLGTKYIMEMSRERYVKVLVDLVLAASQTNQNR
jgi:AcrR family transcriptional regulator